MINLKMCCMNKFVAKFRISPNRSIVQQQLRSFSSNEAAIALRPFYFAVHPDRFALQPDLQKNNEKALKTFNGYLNNVFLQPDVRQRPIRIEFAIKDKENNLTSIRLFLSGNDPVHILRTTLEKCNLNTSSLPPPPPTPSAKFSPRSRRVDISRAIGQLLAMGNPAMDLIRERDAWKRKKRFLMGFATFIFIYFASVQFYFKFYKIHDK